jgi:hypothetical protein
MRRITKSNSVSFTANVVVDDVGRSKNPEGRRGVLGANQTCELGVAVPIYAGSNVKRILAALQFCGQ